MEIAIRKASKLIGRPWSPLIWRDDDIFDRLKAEFKEDIVSLDRPDYNSPSPYFGVTLKIDMEKPINHVYGVLRGIVAGICKKEWPNATIDPDNSTARFIVPLYPKPKRDRT